MNTYEKLAAPPPTPPDEICQCPVGTPVKLMEALGFNPVHCLLCNLEVPPERLDLTQDLAERLADWNNLHQAFTLLWLDSGEYEAMAAHELFRIDSPVSRRGLALAKELNRIIPTYFVLRDDQSRDDYSPRNSCPLCGKALVNLEPPLDWRACHDCHLVSPGE